MVLLRAFWYAFDRNFLKRVYDVLALPLNDYYAATRLDPSRPDEAARMSSIFDLYAKQGIKCVYFTVPVSFDETVSLHLTRRTEFAERIRSLHKRKTSVSIVSEISLTDKALSFPGLHRLTFRHNKAQYIFLRISPSGDTDALRAMLHALIFRHKLIPVILETERVLLTVPEDAVNSVLSIPHAVYQIDLHSLSTHNTRRLVSKLYASGKTVVFGSGDRFDLYLYNNPEYYTKLLSQAIGADNLGLFILQHNRVFR